MSNDKGLEDLPEGMYYPLLVARAFENALSVESHATLVAAA